MKHLHDRDYSPAAGSVDGNSLKPAGLLRSFRAMANAKQLMQFKSVIATAEPPLLGPERRLGTTGETDIICSLESFFSAQKIPEAPRQLLRSAALLWHDHLDSSHTISQGIETREGSWLHGIMHRREPDYGNAKYWFRRVVPHPDFSELADRVTALLQDDELKLAARLVENVEWKPFAFIDECERAEQGNDASLTLALRKVQAAEFDVLVESIFRS